MDALRHLQELIRFDSTSFRSNLSISDHIQTVLEERGLATERIEYDDPSGVRKANVIGKLGDGLGGMAYFGHTDVVPAEHWSVDNHGPFDPVVKGGRLYGRGSCDMKGSIACMLAAVERFPKTAFKHPLYLTCTADEEVGYWGAAEVAARAKYFEEMVAGQSRGIVGEPTQLEVVYAHKGTCGIVATAYGRAAHSSTREGVNANLAMIPYLAEMKRIYDETEADPVWQSDEFDPPTISWNIGINDQATPINVTAPQSVCTVYFRPMPGQDLEALVVRARKTAESLGLDFEVRADSPPLYVDPNSPFVQEVLRLAGKTTPRTASYGTDGTMLTALKNLVVLGPGNIALAHTTNESIALEELEAGTEAFAKLIHAWCCD